jgi:hypothetical protein
MNRTAASRTQAPKTLAEQKADFTAEGSPPPSKVSNVPPVGSPDPGPRRPPQVPIRGTIRLKRAAAPVDR